VPKKDKKMPRTRIVPEVVKWTNVTVDYFGIDPILEIDYLNDPTYGTGAKTYRIIEGRAIPVEPRDRNEEIYFIGVALRGIEKLENDLSMPQNNRRKDVIESLRSSLSRYQES